MSRVAITREVLAVAENYRHMGRSIQKDALIARAAGRNVDPMMDRYGRIARMAAIAEEVNQPAAPRPCSICGGDTVCVRAELDDRRPEGLA